MLIKPSGSANRSIKELCVGDNTVCDVRTEHEGQDFMYFDDWCWMLSAHVLIQLYRLRCMSARSPEVGAEYWSFWRYVQETLVCYNNSDVLNFRRQNIYFVSWCIIIIIIIIIIFIIFTQNIYNCISATNHVSTVYSVAGVLYLQFVLLVMLFHMLTVLYFYINTSRSMCVVPIIALFCSYLISCCLCMFLRCFFWVILKWFQLPLLWLVSSLVLHSKYTVFVLYCFRTFSASWSYLCLIIIIIIIIIVSNTVWSHYYCILSTTPMVHTSFLYLFRLSISSIR